MDPVILAGMIFSVVVIMLIGGFVLLFPLTRQLGAYLEKRMLAENSEASRGQLAQLARAVENLGDEVARLSDRQDFTERLLEGPDDDAPPG
jgi:hypothetical protein